MKNIDLIKYLEEISLRNHLKILKLQGYMIKNLKKEELELIIYKGFSSSTTHPIEFDPYKNVINEKLFFTKGQLYLSPLKKESNNLIKESNQVISFLDENYWN